MGLAELSWFSLCCFSYGYLFPHVSWSLNSGRNNTFIPQILGGSPLVLVYSKKSTEKAAYNGAGKIKKLSGYHNIFQNSKQNYLTQWYVTPLSPFPLIGGFFFPVWESVLPWDILGGWRKRIIYLPRISFPLVGVKGWILMLIDRSV